MKLKSVFFFFTLLSFLCNMMATFFKYLCSGKKHYSIFEERNE